MEAGTIMNGQEGDPGFGVTAGTDPALDGQAGANGKFALEHIGYGCMGHLINFSNLLSYRTPSPVFRSHHLTRAESGLKQKMGGAAG
jgi:hypothetical protein